MSGLTTLAVDAASVSLAPDGGYHLLLHTTAGVVRFHLPLAVGCSVFRITNPTATEFVPKENAVRRQSPTNPADNGPLAEACADWINDPEAGISEVAQRHGLKFASSLRERLIKTLGLTRYQELSALRGNKPHGPRRRVMPV